MEERKALVRKQRIILGSLGLLLLFYIGGAVRGVFRFEPHSFVNGIEVSGMSLGQAEEAVSHVADTYALTIKGPAGESETLDGSGLSLAVADASGVKKALKDQRALGWPVGRFFRKDYQAALVMRYDENALNTKIDSLSMLDASKMTAPTDASLVEQKDGTCAIAAEQPGTELDAAAAKQKIHDAVASGQTAVDVTDCAVQPKILSTDEGLNKRMQQWNALLKSAGLTFRIAEHDVTLDGPAVASLLSDDGSMVTVSRDKVTAMVYGWKDQYDTYGKSFPFRTADGETVTIDPLGDYGYALNDEATVEDVCSRIANGDSGTYDAEYWNKPPYDTNSGLGGNYVEISLKKQHLWVYRDGKVVVDTDVVTGLPVHGRITYMGCFAIKKKMTDVSLGDIKTEGYSTPVNYWVPFNGGEGLHDAPWRDAFGGSIWKSDGSHGCINCPEDVMPEIYKNVEIGEAVVIYGDPYDESVYTGQQ